MTVPSVQLSDGRSIPQMIILRWGVELGTVPVPRSETGFCSLVDRSGGPRRSAIVFQTPRSTKR